MRTIYSKDGPEISDLIVSYDPVTLARIPVSKTKTIDEFLAIGNKTAAGIVRAIPAHNNILDQKFVDRLLIQSHCELQRLSEEYFHGFRVNEFLQPFIHAIRQQTSDADRIIRVVDIGCGTGYVIRWLAKYGALKGVQLVGADYNSALVGEANRLAALENLDCKFVVANAFKLEEPANICFSTGVVHHFRDDSLVEFFRNHDQKSLDAFFHFDFQPNILAPLGSWVFHVIRMREPLAKHDGVLSAARAHSAETLLAAARGGAVNFNCGMYGRRFWSTRLPRVFHTLVGIRPQLKAEFEHQLAARSLQLSDF